MLETEEERRRNEKYLTPGSLESSRLPASVAAAECGRCHGGGSAQRRPFLCASRNRGITGIDGGGRRRTLARHSAGDRVGHRNRRPPEARPAADRRRAFLLHLWGRGGGYRHPRGHRLPQFRSRSGNVYGQASASRGSTDRRRPTTSSDPGRPPILSGWPRPETGNRTPGRAGATRAPPAGTWPSCDSTSRSGARVP